MDRRTFLKGAGATGLALALSPLESLINEAQAAHGILIGEYYDSGVPIDVMPGARKCGKSAVKGNCLGFEAKVWIDYYFQHTQYSSTLQNMFRNLDGQKVVIHSPKHEGEEVVFEFDKFHEFNIKTKASLVKFTLWYDGFMSFENDIKEYTRIVVPIIPEIIYSIKSL